jgi:hypothetical protein
MKQHRNSNSKTTKIIASKHSCKILHQQNPLTLPCGRQPIKQVKRSPPLRTSQGTWTRNNIEKAHTFAEHLAKVFQLHPSEMNPKRKKH